MAKEKLWHRCHFCFYFLSLSVDKFRLWIATMTKSFRVSTRKKGEGEGGNGKEEVGEEANVEIRGKTEGRRGEQEDE